MTATAVEVVAPLGRRRTSTTQWLALATGFGVPLKALRLDLFGQSVYLPYLTCAVATLMFAPSVLTSIRRHFLGPAAVVGLFAAWGAVRSGTLVGPLITSVKLAIAIVAAASMMALLLRAESQLYLGVLIGAAVNVAYAAYQMVSGVLFGFRLPYTSIHALDVGLGLSRRYGLVRVTGFAEEPSFLATLLIGSTLLLAAHSWRIGRRRRLVASVLIGVAGLAMTTSNNLFATIAIVALGFPLVRVRRVSLLLAAYYGAVLIVTPYVLMRDITYFARFSAFEIFRSGSLIDQLLGHGIGTYPQYFARQPLMLDGEPVESLASIWGGFLFEGGVVLAGLAVTWIALTIRRTGWREGVALLALLLMLSNYNSPWWPIVSLAVAQCLVLARRRTVLGPSISTLQRWRSSGLPLSSTTDRSFCS